MGARVGAWVYGLAVLDVRVLCCILLVRLRIWRDT